MAVLARAPAGRIEIETTSPAQTGVLADFLGRMFVRDGGGSSRPDDPAQMGWKYWAPRADWHGSRSFAAIHDGRIVAHAAAWPVSLLVPGQVVPAAHLIDWASDPAYPGVGARLLRRIGSRVRLMIATGGSDAARRILPVLGFRSHGDVSVFARPVRPLLQALTTVGRGWRVAPRLARNTVWRLWPPLAVPRGWAATPINPRDVPRTLWSQPTTAAAVTDRNARLYEYMLRSPSARHTLFGLETRRGLIGVFCIARVPHVARIADLWLPSSSVDDWTAAFRTATAVAAREPAVCEVSAWASTAIAAEALRRAGFRRRDRCALGIAGAADVLSGRELHVQMLDSDASFLCDRGVDYLT